jgi:hypothetical protein
MAYSYTEEEKLEFRRFWDSLTENGRGNALKCQRGGILDFKRKLWISWMITPQLIEYMYL